MEGGRYDSGNVENDKCDETFLAQATVTIYSAKKWLTNDKLIFVKPFNSIYNINDTMINILNNILYIVELMMCHIGTIADSRTKNNYNKVFVISYTGQM